MVFPGNSRKIFGDVNPGIFHLFLLDFSKVRCNTCIIIFDSLYPGLMGISFVYILIFNGQME